MIEERIRFRQIHDDDISVMAAWTRDPEVIRFMENVRPMSDDEERAWLRGVEADPNEEIVAIERREDRRLIGTCGMHRKTDGAVELGIFIGDKREWGKGYGAEAMRMLAQRARMEGANHIYLRVDIEHVRGIRAYEKAGFRVVETRQGAADQRQEHVMEWQPAASSRWLI